MSAVELPRWEEGWTPCRTSDPELWFPDLYTSGEKAKTLCREACPERMFAQCFEYALHHAVQGIWAATSDKGRQKIRRERGIVCTPFKEAS